jgi:hypothetical protein
MIRTNDYNWLNVKYEVEKECKNLYQPNIIIRLLGFSAVIIVWFIDKVFSLFFFLKASSKKQDLSPFENVTKREKFKR